MIVGSFASGYFLRQPIEDYAFRLQYNKNNYARYLKLETIKKNNEKKPYLVDIRTNKRVPIYENLRVGNLEYRLKNLIGDYKDKESIKGKTNQEAIKIKQKIKNAYIKIKNYFGLK